MFRRTHSLLVVAAVSALLTAGAGNAANVTATATVSAGSLSLSSSAAPSVSATLNGTDQTPTYTMGLSANDETGSGTGWNLTVTSTSFSTGGGSPHTLPTNTSAITAITASCAQGTCTNPTNSVSYPLGVPAGGSAPTAVKFFNAAADSGMGDFTVTPTVRVTILANAYAGTYTSTVTLAVVSGP
ncbi:MAG: hypothetical protein E6G36_06155 [Actinobacteria bacterium]|nr:MAG: hypothetical protein E6G36_06155 [Actinomycetota bacterium]